MNEEINGLPLEIERKFLIKKPKIATLSAQAGVRVYDILQTYLIDEQNRSARVRMSCDERGRVVYTETYKTRLSPLTRTEEEREITKERYTALLAKADPAMAPLPKTRYTFPYRGHLLEVDLFPFFKNTALLEIELSHEQEPFDLPPFLSLIREVSTEDCYGNRTLAKALKSGSLPDEASL
ncbi:MAG: hypothetical protein WDA00_06580 [Eubacteriales bacterium]